MRRLLMAGVLVMLAACGAPGASLPFDKFSTSADFASNVAPFGCTPGQEGLRVELSKDNRHFTMFVIAEGSQHFIVVEWGSDDKPKTIFYGHADGDKIVVDRSHAYSEKADGRSACEGPWLRQGEQA